MNLKLINLYLTPTRCSIQIDSTVSRQVAGATVPEVLNAMDANDRAAFVAFCETVINHETVHVSTTPVTDESERSFLRRLARSAR